MIGANIPAPPAAAGVSGSTGSVDNAILRADGTGGATLQNSAIVIDDATTSTQNNVAITNQHTGQTNSALVLSPKGNGALIIGPKPDGTTTGGNARGANAIDLQSRVFGGSATTIASGVYSFVAGLSNTASGNTAVAIGFNCSSTGIRAFSLGENNQSSADNSFIAGGISNTSSGIYSGILSGQQATSDRRGMQAHSSGRFAANGDAQRARFVLRCKTTTNTGVEMALDGSTTYLGIPSGKIIACTINITGTKSDGSAVAHYLRQYCVKNVGGTSTEVYAPVTIGTDNAAGTTIALSANNTDDTLRILVTGVASETWRWVASVDAVEVAYGT
jgi:hypothetical protein